MNKNDSIEIDINLKDFPDNLTYLITESLDSKNSVNKLAARSTLVWLGKFIIPKLHRLLSSEKSLLYMETAKIIKLKADEQELRAAEAEYPCHSHRRGIDDCKIS